jgi:hypothetical protein
LNIKLVQHLGGEVRQQRETTASASMAAMNRNGGVGDKVHRVASSSALTPKISTGAMASGT